MMDNFGDRMKMYEKQGPQRFIPLVPVIARLDGKAFHTFCKGLKKPYDDKMMDTMFLTTLNLVRDSGANIGYTQSDEITLLFYSDNYHSQIYFDGKIQKLNSVLSSMATYYFNDFKRVYLPRSKKDIPALFDCRVWQVPIEEVVNCFLWREQDAVKNSISSAAQAEFGHKQTMNKNSQEKQDMLHDVGINWNDYPVHFKRGIYLQKQSTFRKFTCEEIDKLPQKHEARLNPDLEVLRHEVRKLKIPPLAQVENNKKMVLYGEEPKYK